jgi:hypothetical protein
LVFPTIFEIQNGRVGYADPMCGAGKERERKVGSDVILMMHVVIVGTSSHDGSSHFSWNQLVEQ